MAEPADRSFSQGQPVDSIETEKSRIVLCELETDWWVLAVGAWAATATACHMADRETVR